MEIIYKTNNSKSNFTYCNEIFKGKKVLNGFNKLSEELICELIDGNDFNCQNIFFENEIIADLYISYPLSVVVKEEICFNSLHSLITEIRKVYHQIYYTEAKSMTKKTRTKADSKFGIWGHGIYDLVIESIRILEGEDKPLVEIGIGS